jgi:hypothetical protein
MRFSWDSTKDRANFAKHGIRFSEAALIFEGTILSRVDHREDYGQLREVSIGTIAGLVVVVVVHTDEDDDTIRIISARRATQKERKKYYVYCAKNSG